MSEVTGIPGMEVAEPQGGGALDVRRSAPNVWWVLIGDGRAIHDEDLAPVGRAPSGVLGSLADRMQPGAEPVAVTVAKVELDVCGAWLTVANADSTRPLVVRRAGWVDVRGHPSAPLAGAAAQLPDDRIGLGPGDAVVFQVCVPDACDGDIDDQESDAVLDDLLAAAGWPAGAIAEHLRDRGPGSLAPIVIGVPAELGDDPKQRVAVATGVPIDEIALPGYPLGDLQPELWREPPPPPRIARLRLGADASSPRAVRQLLDRLLASWRLEDRIDDDGVRLAASELATNAVLHAGTPEAATIRYLGSVVRLEVDDRSPVPPAPREADERGGRGLPLVDAVSSAWGADRHPQGKRVWCEIPVLGAAAAR